MSPSDSGATGNGLSLTIEAADSATEIFVINGELRMVDRGVGRLVTKPLPAGIYKIKSRAGAETREQHVVLREPGQRVSLPRFEFASPVPLQDTSRTHEYHMAAAEAECQKVHVHAGAGSWLFVMAREWTPSDRAPRNPRAPNPAVGLSLLADDGTVIADIEAQATCDSQVPDPWAACTIALPPGSYRLALKLPAGGSLYQTIVTSPGWQTQVFLLMQDMGDTRRADLLSGSILMSRGPGFSCGNVCLREAELARLGLANERRVISTELRQMLNGKFDNPMLGIYAAHLLLLETTPQIHARDGSVAIAVRPLDTQTLQTVVNNLRMLLDAPHPDVEALALAAGMGSAHVFNTMPMLRRSWKLVVDATVLRPELIPPDSMAAGVAGNVRCEEPWLVWSHADPSVGDGLESAIQVAFDQHFMAPPPAPLEQESAFAAVRKRRSTSPTPRERAPSVAAQILESAHSFAAPATLSPDERKIRLLVKTLGIPRSSVERMFNMQKQKDGGER